MLRLNRNFILRGFSVGVSADYVKRRVEFLRLFVSDLPVHEDTNRTAPRLHHTEPSTRLLPTRLTTRPERGIVASFLLWMQMHNLNLKNVRVIIHNNQHVNIPSQERQQISSHMLFSVFCRCTQIQNRISGEARSCAIGNLANAIFHYCWTVAKSFLRARCSHLHP